MKSVLMKTGMTEGEARVYLALLELGITTTGPLIDKSNITSSKVYLILERLEQKGLISHIIKNNVKYFKAADPKRLKDYMEKKAFELEEDKKEIEKWIPSLRLKLEKEAEPEATLFQGIKGFVTAREEFMMDLRKGDEYVVFGSAASSEGPFSTRICDFAGDNEKRGIRTRMIFPIELKGLEMKFVKFKLTKIRFIKGMLPSSIAVTKTHVLQMAYGEKPIQVLIASTPLATSFYAFFESVWKQAEC